MLKAEKWIGFLLFLAYLGILSWIILLKMQFSLSALRPQDGLVLQEAVNWIPFGVSGLHRQPAIEFIQNVAIFLPFGILFKTFAPKANWFVITLLGFLLSVFYEWAQFELVIGYADITDVIANTSGALGGVIIYSLVLFIFRSRRFVNAVFLILAVVFCGFSIHLGWDRLHTARREPVRSTSTDLPQVNLSDLPEDWNDLFD